MIEEDFFKLIDPILREAGATPEPGEEFREPALDVLRYHHRPVRWSWVPVLGRGLGVVAVVRQPVDIRFEAEGIRRLLTRVAMAVNGRFPPLRSRAGLVLGLTTVITTPEPIGPGDDAVLAAALGRLPRMRAVPMGVIRFNLGQEAMSHALAADPEGLFPEAAALADALSLHFRRYVPLFEE